ncbi:phage tail protein [Nocardioides stalactiti]|uniref:phage tail protein n=1 Tax=Nocardioides stalactiti TaxID=2755356 RepID=UPI001604574D|nr:tail fiber protein [Nocardioides stalactiti]
MSEPFLGEIKLMAFNFPPKGWALCNGQFLPINQNQGLFSVLGTTYGGNGVTTFALPNLRGRVPLHFGAGYTLGEAAGSTSVTINAQTMPTHTHQVNASTLATGGAAIPTGRYLGGSNNVYRTDTPTTTMNPATVSSVGGSQPHNNMAPYLVLNFCIALQGIFPSQN